MSSPGNHQGGDGGNDSEQSVIKIDPDGDLTLVVGKTKTPFLVCSKALSRSAPFWKCCLYGPFKEAKPAAGQEWVVELPEDNPSGLRCLLLLVHGLGYKMPKINLQLAFEITVITNKYDMTRSLWAVAGPWLKDLKPIWPAGVHDASVVPQLQWLWLTKQLGDFEQHSETFFELSQTVRISLSDGSHFLLKPFAPACADVLTKDTIQGYDAEKDIILLFIHEIQAARSKSLLSIQYQLRHNIGKLKDEIKRFDLFYGSGGASICKAQSSAQRRLCEYAMQGIITRMSEAKDSALRSISKILISVDDYLSSALSFTSGVEEELHIISGKEHKNCTPFTRKLPTRNSLKTERLLILQCSKSGKFSKQARLSGLVKGGGGNEDGEEEQGTSGSHIVSHKRPRDEFEGQMDE